MGYAILQLNASFSIPAEHTIAALNAIRSLHGKETCGEIGKLHFMWINDSEEFINASTLSEALGVWRWAAEEDDNDGIVELYFTGQNLGDEDLLFSVLAPYVTPSSSIAVVGEDGAIWRWYFDGQRVIRQNGTVHFDT